MIRANANVTIAGNLSNEKSILAQYLESVNWQTQCVSVCGGVNHSFFSAHHVSPHAFSLCVSPAQLVFIFEFFHASDTVDIRFHIWPLTPRQC